MITISKPKIEDARGSIEVQYIAWIDTYPNEKAGITVEDIKERLKNAFEPDRIKKRVEAITSTDPNEKMLVAKEGDKVVGYCFGTKNEEKNQLSAIYILPEYHGKGIGTRLWNEFKDFFDKDKDIYVEVADYNTKAINFYNKLGFVDTGRRFTDERFRMKSGALIPEMEMKILVK